MATTQQRPPVTAGISLRTISELEERVRASCVEAGSLFEHTATLPLALALDEGEVTTSTLGSSELPKDLLPSRPSEAATPTSKKKPKFSPAARRRMNRDKQTFVLGLANVCITSLWLGASPETFYVKFIVTMSTLFTLRFIIYRPKGHHYYMAEYCYWGNLQLALYFWLTPSNALIRKIVFSQMTGPITWSIILQRNSMVLHSLDKMTSLAMHTSPAVAAWCMRWRPRGEWVPPPGTPAADSWDRASLVQLCLLPMLPYLLWFGWYYAVVFVFKAKKIAKNNYPTLYTLMTKSPTSPITKFVKLAPEPLQPLMYMSGHAFWTWVSLLVTPLWWHSCIAHTAFLVLCLLMSFYNGASYYFEVFATRYMKELEENKED